MDKQPVGTLPDLTASSLDDEIMVITNSEYNQLKKEKISDFITDLTSTDENNALTKGTDGKMFVTDFGNASNITEGTLPTSVLPEIPLEKIPDIPKDKLPEIETNDLPDSGITAGTYTYPTDIVVNSKGQVTSITEGQAGANNANQDLSNISEAGKEVIRETAGSDYHLTQNQITNCILSAPNGVATYSSSTFTIKQGLKVLIPNGRNEDKTLKNIEYTVPEDKTINLAGIGDITYDFTLLYGNTGTWSLSQNYKEADTPPAFYGAAQYYLNTKENIMYFNDNNERWEPATVAVLGKGKLENGVVTSFTPYQPVELLKRSDKEEIASWSFPSGSFQTLSTPVQGSLYTATQDGYFVLSAFTNKTYGYIALNYDSNPSKFSTWCGINQTGVLLRCFIPAKKGVKVGVELYQVENAKLLFYPVKGETND